MPTEKLIPENVLIYDEECFFCSNYVRLLNLKETIPGIKLVDARDKNAVVRLNCADLNLDEGVVLILDGKLYYGAEAINYIALLSTPVKIFNRINKIAFSNKFLASVFYPILKFGRKVYFLLANKKMIRDS